MITELWVWTAMREVMPNDVDFDDLVGPDGKSADVVIGETVEVLGIGRAPPPEGDGDVRMRPIRLADLVRERISLTKERDDALARARLAEAGAGLIAAERDAARVRLAHLERLHDETPGLHDALSEAVDAALHEHEHGDAP